ncbi:MAG: alpha/beta hydrolase [Acidobacteriota bacterium]|nr:alpha/beta hydrolase [Acidobacteriota bacterium]
MTSPGAAGALGNLRTVLKAYGDGTVFGEAFGQGPVAVVWLHGWARRGQDFAVAASRLADEGVASVALDLPGFGSSPPPSAPGGAGLYARTVASVIESLGPDPVVLVGHSFGGRVATVLAARRPDLVRALVLTGTPLARTGPTRRPAWRHRVVRAAHARGLVSERRMEAWRQRHGSADYRAARGVVRDVLVVTVNESYEEDMARVRAPVHLLWGADDREVPVSVLEASLEHWGAPVSVRTLEGVGHFVPLEAPDDLVAVVREALA